MISWKLPSGRISVVCVGAHPDDIEIGCGGLLLALAERGDVTVVGGVATGTSGRIVEQRAALPRFAPGAVVHIADLPDTRLPAYTEQVREFLDVVAADAPTPDLVLAPRVDDAHQDHRVVGQLASSVWRDAQVLHYEIPKWDGDLGAATHLVPLRDETARRKVALLNECYPSQADRDWWDDEMFLGLLRLRGMECRTRYAEGFYSSKTLLGVGAS